MRDLVRKDSIEELVGHRNRALELYRQAAETMNQARQAHMRACIGNSYISGVDHDHFRFHADRPHEFGATMRTKVDRDMWRALVVNTPIGSLMDTEEKKKFQKDLEGEPPEITVDNCFATMQRLYGDADAIFRRGLVNAFSGLCRDYKSHDGFKIGDRIILTWLVTYDSKFGGWLQTNYHKEDVLCDIDRCMYVLDGKGTPDRQQGLYAAMRTAVQNWQNQRGMDGAKLECETEYWRLKFYKNGNGHLYPKRMDLIERANKLIAEHFGEVLGQGPESAKKDFRMPEATPQGCKLDFFPTPAAVVERMVAAAELRQGQRVLEPSAGSGSLADAVIAATGQIPVCFELDHGRCEELRERNIRCLELDFLQYPATREFDRVLMNPPFSRCQEALHVLHALNCLKLGGKLVAIMSPGIQFRQEKAYAELRRQLEGLNATIEPLPDNSFAEVSTGVRAVMVTVGGQVKILDE